MVKRKTSKLVKRKTAKKAKAPWHPCDDCIMPVAESLGEIARRWNFSFTPPRLDCIDRVYRKHDVELLITWLKICISVDFATDFEATLYDPVRAYRKLNRRAWDLLGRALEGPYPKGNAVTPLLKEWYGQLSKLPDELREEAHGQNSGLVDIEEQFDDIHATLEDAVRYLWQVSAVLKSKVEGKGIEMDAMAAISQKANRHTAPLTKTRIGELFVVHRNQVDTAVLSKYEHAVEPNGRIRMLVSDMPPAYFQADPPK